MRTFEQLAREAALWLPALIEAGEIEPEDTKITVRLQPSGEVLKERTLDAFLADLKEATDSHG